LLRKAYCWLLKFFSFFRDRDNLLIKRRRCYIVLHFSSFLLYIDTLVLFFFCCVNVIFRLTYSSWLTSSLSKNYCLDSFYCSLSKQTKETSWRLIQSVYCLSYVYTLAVFFNKGIRYSIHSKGYIYICNSDRFLFLNQTFLFKLNLFWINLDIYIFVKVVWKFFSIVIFIFKLDIENIF